MKGNEIDGLFREKLSHQKISPPANAWDKIEDNLGKKKKGAYFWLSIAASIVVIFTIGGLTLMRNSEKTTNAAKLQANTETPKATDNSPETDKAENGAKPNTPTDKTTHVQPIQPAQPFNTSQLVAQLNDEPLDATPQTSQEEFEPALFKAEIDRIDITNAISIKSMAKIKRSLVTPISLTDYYTETLMIDESDIVKKKKFNVFNGIISIAKGVNSAKETLSELRTAKNEFVSNELKYGTTEGDGEPKAPDTKQEK